MNSLSLMLYLADVVDNAGASLAATVIIGSIAYCGFSFFYFLSSLHEGHERFHGVTWPLWVFAICMIVWTFIPSRETVLLIAGSEVGEAVATSEAGKRIIDQVEAAISAQLEELAVEK